jgi:nitrogen fixation/metabolism regulation signal transduction histidine kinase
MGRFEIKIVALLLLISISAFVISLVLMDDVLRVSSATLREHARELRKDLADSVPVYRELVQTKRELYDRTTASLAESPHLTWAALGRDPAEARRVLDRLRASAPTAERLAVHDETARPVAASGAEAAPDLRYRVVRPVGATGWTLLAEFPISAAVRTRFERIGRHLEAEAPHVLKIDRALQPYFFPVFARYFGVALLVVMVVGLIFARRLARRVTSLSRATRRVAAGDLDVALEPRGADEIGQLHRDFNEMVGELRRNRAQIAYLQKISAWQEVARRLAHEIKNPLTPILLAMQEVQQKYGGDDPRYQKLLDAASEIVKEEIDGLRRQVEAFSAFAKLPQVQVEPEDIAGVMDDFLRSLGALEGQGEIDWQPPAPAIQVAVDKLLFRRVLYNLVENAFQAAQAAGVDPRVRLRVQQPAARRLVVVSVEDNGPGVPEELRDRVFDPYFTTRSSGTGLGLAIVKKIVLEHGGTIDVEAGAGGGARFVIRLPVAG